jgi:hypothetical protein
MSSFSLYARESREAPRERDLRMSSASNASNASITSNGSRISGQGKDRKVSITILFRKLHKVFEGKKLFYYREFV